MAQVMNKPYLTWALSKANLQVVPRKRNHGDQQMPKISVCSPSLSMESCIQHPYLALPSTNSESFAGIAATRYGPSSPRGRLKKPPVPYQVGWKFTAYAHDPPEPTPTTTDCLFTTHQRKIEQRQESPVKLCQMYPPLPGLPGQHSLQLEIQTLLQAGDGWRAQVFTVSLCGLSDPDGDYPSTSLSHRLFVAKVFDPLYLDDGEGIFDPFLCMDRFYTHEAGAYQTLKDFQGREIPEYYGSYSINLSLPAPHKSDSYREVRMILMEYIQGTTMSRLQPNDLPMPTRKQILYSIIDLESRIYAEGVKLRDLAPRNIILVTAGSRSHAFKPRALFIDFDDTSFQRFMDDSTLSTTDKFLGQYVSPLLRWTHPPNEFQGWIDWDWAPWVKRVFDHTETTITPKMRRAWLIDI